MSASPFYDCPCLTLRAVGWPLNRVGISKEFGAPFCGNLRENALHSCMMNRAWQDDTMHPCVGLLEYSLAVRTLILSVRSKSISNQFPFTSHTFKVEVVVDYIHDCCYLELGGSRRSSAHSQTIVLARVWTFFLRAESHSDLSLCKFQMSTFTRWIS